MRGSFHIHIKLAKLQFCIFHKLLDRRQEAAVWGKTNGLLSFHTTWTIQKAMHPTILAASGTSLPSCHLAVTSGYIHFIKPLLVIVGGIHIQTHRLMGRIYEV
jgi:hypothetical protein